MQGLMMQRKVITSTPRISTTRVKDAGLQKLMDAGLGIAAGLVSLRPPTSAAGSTACAPKMAKILNRNVASTSCLPFPSIRVQRLPELCTPLRLRIAAHSDCKISVAGPLCLVGFDRRAFVARHWGRRDGSHYLCY